MKHLTDRKAAEIRAAMDELMNKLNTVAPGIHGADILIWYSSNDGTWKWNR